MHWSRQNFLSLKKHSSHSMVLSLALQMVLWKSAAFSGKEVIHKPWRVWTDFGRFWPPPFHLCFTILLDKAYVVIWTFDNPLLPLQVHMVYEWPQTGAGVSANPTWKCILTIKVKNSSKSLFFGKRKFIRSFKHITWENADLDFACLFPKTYRRRMVNSRLLTFTCVFRRRGWVN